MTYLDEWVPLIRNLGVQAEENQPFFKWCWEVLEQTGNRWEWSAYSSEYEWQLRAPEVHNPKGVVLNILLKKNPMKAILCIYYLFKVK